MSTSLRLALIGQSGQVAQSLVQHAALRSFTIQTFGRPACDLAEISTHDLQQSIQRFQPDIVVNAAAYTAVDKAEGEQEPAFAINSTGARKVAEVACHLNVPLIHLSTDYVFNGTLERPYLETDQPKPMGVYGLSKYHGEQAVTDTSSNHVILRTSWVYSPFGHNFVKTMLRLTSTQTQIRVVADQKGCPTSAFDLADTICQIADFLHKNPQSGRGLYHCCGTGGTNWAEFARTIFAMSEKYGGPFSRIEAITSKDYPTHAKRPQNSCLDCTKLDQSFGIKLPEWQHSVEICVRQLLQQEVHRF